MIDELLKSANGPLQDLLANAGGSRDTADAVKETFLELIEEKAKSGDFEGIREMFSGNETPADSPAVDHLKEDLGSGLSKKLGIDTDKAISIAAQALPLLLNIFNKKVNDAPLPNEEIAESVVKSMKKEGGSGLGGVLSSIFGADDDPKAVDLGDVINFGAGLFKKKKK